MKEMGEREEGEAQADTDEHLRMRITD